MKNKMVKIAFIILSVVFVFSACMTVFAVTTKSVTANQNGIEATLNFNKQEYNANEEVAVTLNVKNNNSYAVNNVQTELIVPSTIKLSKGSLKQEVFSLNAGESKVQEVALEKVVETNNNEPTVNSPQTGDNVDIYIAMMVVSAVALVIIAVKKKWIHKKKVMSLVLCFTLVGAMTLTSVVNADVTIKEFTVEGTIKYDGEDVVIKGKVTYTHEIYSKLQIDGADKGMYVEGDTVTITAEDAPEGKHFAGWTVVKGNVTLADKNASTTTFVMGTEEVEIKANYEVDTFTIEVTSGENGKVNPAGSVSVNYGENQEFTIIANTGYHIENVEVDGVNKGKIDTYTFDNVKENHTIKATFALNICTIRYLVNGTVYSSSDIVLCDEASPSFFNSLPGYHIDSVEVDGVNKGKIDEYTFTNVKESHTINVILAIDTFTITSSANAGGTITESATVDYGSSKTFTITPNAHYHIADVKVDGASVGAKTSYEFTNITASHTIEATFAIDTFTITSSAGANGTITSTASVGYGGSKTFTMTANSGYGVKDVKVDGTSVGPVTSYTFDDVKETHTIEVEFDTATIVTDATSFRNAVKQDGIIILANDITLDDNGHVDISKNIILHGDGHKIVLSRFSGATWSRVISVRLLNSANLKSVNCNFTGSGPLMVESGASLAVYGGEIDIIDNLGNLSIYSGSINGRLFPTAYSGYTVIYDVVLCNNSLQYWDEAYSECPSCGVVFPEICSVRGGCFYFDVSDFLDSSKYVATQTKDAEGVDIWVVTAR